MTEAEVWLSCEAGLQDRRRMMGRDKGRRFLRLHDDDDDERARGRKEESHKKLTTNVFKVGQSWPEMVH